MTSHWDELNEENRVMREFIESVAKRDPHFRYASASSHPDTNLAYDTQLRAKRILRLLEEMRQGNTLSSD